MTTITAAAIESFVERSRYHTLAAIRETQFGGAPPETTTTHPPPVTRLPVEVFERIIVYLIYDTRSLRACVLTCYPWYIAVAPHLHHTLTVETSYHRKPEGSKSLQHKYDLGLLPLVRVLRVRACDYSSVGRSLAPSNHHTLHQFSALTNVRELWIDFLDIPEFMPRINQCFGHFLPTVRSLGLGEPKGSRRHIIYFIGLFEHLENLSLTYSGVRFQEELSNDLTLVPGFHPPLNGWLKMMCVRRVELVEDMIDLLGVRFRYMNLFNVNGMQLLLDACAETLELLRLYPTDPRGERFLWRRTRSS